MLPAIKAWLIDWLWHLLICDNILISLSKMRHVIFSLNEYVMLCYTIWWWFCVTRITTGLCRHTGQRVARQCSPVSDVTSRARLCRSFSLILHSTALYCSWYAQTRCSSDSAGMLCIACAGWLTVCTCLSLVIYDSVLMLSDVKLSSVVVVKAPQKSRDQDWDLG